MSAVILALDHSGKQTVVGVAPDVKKAMKYVRRMRKEVQEIKIKGTYYYRDFRECEFLIIDYVPEIM